MPIYFGKVLAICQPSAYVYLDAEILRLTVGLRCQSDHTNMQCITYSQELNVV